MSLATWKAIHYAVTAEAAAALGDLAAVRHAMWKWGGLSAEVLAMHDVFVDTPHIRDDDDMVLKIASETCALCERHEGCKTCPLFEAFGGISCSDNFADDSQPYDVWYDTGDPAPMQAALAAAEQYVLAQMEPPR